jgi:hypothetical protein
MHEADIYVNHTDLNICFTSLKKRLTHVNLSDQPPPSYRQGGA